MPFECADATQLGSITTPAWHSRGNKGKQYTSLKDLLILTDLQRGMFEQNGGARNMDKLNVCRTAATVTANCVVSGLR